MKWSGIALYFSLLLVNAHTILAQPMIVLLPFASGLDKPVTLTNSGNNHLFAVEQTGRII